MLIKSALRDVLFCVIWHDKHSGEWLTAFASPFPAARDFPRKREQNKTPRDNLLINPLLEMTVLADTPIVISTEAKRSGEISPSDGTGGITVGDLSTQSIINAFSLCPIPTRSSARDDGGGERPPSFRPKRSGVEKSHSSMVKKALRQLFNPPLLSVFSPGSLPVWRRRE